VSAGQPRRDCVKAFASRETPLYRAGMRRPRVILALTAALFTASTMALGIAPVQADGAGSQRALPPNERQPRSTQITIMGDSHIMVMIDALYPGAHSNGNEGTRIDGKYVIYGINGIKLTQVVRGRGTVKAGVSSVGTTNVDKWRKALKSGPNTIVVDLGTNDGGPQARDIDKFMSLAGKKRDVFWIMPYYTSCPVCRQIHDYELKAAAKRFANLHLVPMNDLGLDVSSDGLHAFGLANSRAIWKRTMETIDRVKRS